MQVGKGNAETFGLSMFSGLLGRLNGKSDEELEKKQAALRDVELGSFHARKYGSMNFVSGGLLVGDKIEFPKSTVLPARKRKAEDGVAAEEPEVKKAKKTKNSVVREARSSAETGEEQMQKAEKKERKERDSGAKEERRAHKAARKAHNSSTDGGDKVKLKAEKRARKEERRARKEERRARGAAKNETRSKPTAETSASSSENDDTATPPVANTIFGGRHAVRQRYIMQKRRAHMDPQALKEIFMLQGKAASS